MSKKILLIISLLLACVIQTYGQPICTGKMLNAKDGNIDVVCFLRSLNPIGNKTKYTIFFNGTEIYEVDFTYYQEGDSVLIQFFDEQNTTVKRECVKLMSYDSHFLICDYEPNIWPIKDSTSTTTYPILFGIDNPNKQFITLYQFQAIGGTQTQFILQNVPKNVRDNHYDAVLDYRRIMDIKREHDSSVARLKSDMISYKDSIIKSIEIKENAIKLKEASLSANTVLQSDFTKKLDSIFIGYFKNIYSFSDDAFDVNFTFNCNGYGNIIIDPDQNIFFKNGPQKNWLRDSLMLRIQPGIEKGVYKTLTYTYSNLKLKPDFLNWFKKRLATYTNLGDADKPLFTEAQKQINDDLNPYVTRTIDIPTIYSYKFNYTSTVKSPTWKYVKAGGGNDIFIDKSNKEERVEITENLKKIFRNKFGSRGKGKYKLKICMMSVNNDAFKGQDIQLIEKK